MKRNRKIILILAGVCLLVCAYFLILKTAPKNASYFPILLVLVGFDILLWNSIRPLLKRSVRAFRIPFSILYWSPAVILLLSLLASSFFKNYDPSLPGVIYLMGFVFTMYVCKLIPGLLVLLTGAIGRLIRIARRIIHPKEKCPTETGTGLRIANYTGYSVGGVMFVLLILGMILWGYDFRTIEHRLSIEDLPEALKGFRIVQISDLHLGTWPSEKKLEEVITEVNGLSPDLVLFTGDLVNSRTSEAAPFRSNLKGIHTRYPVYAVLGNHDFGDYASWDSPEAKEQNMKDLYTFFDEIGWKLLSNTHDVILLDGDSIAIAGVDNWSVYNRFEKKGDLPKAMKGLTNASMVILLTHDPTHWETEVIMDFPEVDLTLTGHTHGFQFGIETKHVKWSPVQWLYEKWAGIYEYTQPDGRKQYMYVNRGLGAIGYPGRVGIKPEITLFVLE